MAGANFTNVNLKNADLSIIGGQTDPYQFKETKLQNPDFSVSYLYGVTFPDSYLGESPNNAKFSGATPTPVSTVGVSNYYTPLSICSSPSPSPTPKPTPKPTPAQIKPPAPKNVTLEVIRMNTAHLFLRWQPPSNTEENLTYDYEMYQYGGYFKNRQIDKGYGVKAFWKI